jgi:crotonobetainyl-CoA:carnitine CoA-transferase CaiB-like acyl-CoA transferase
MQASLSGTGTYLQIPFMVDFAGRRWDEPSGLAATGWGPLYRLYKGSDRWFFLAAQQPGQLARLAMIEGLHGVDQAPASEFPALLAVRFAAAPAAAWVARLTAAGLSAQVARDVHENMADPVHIARGLSILRDHPELGRICNVGRSRRFSRTRSIHCSRRRRSGATAARSSMRPARAPALASSSPTELSQ